MHAPASVRLERGPRRAWELQDAKLAEIERENGAGIPLLKCDDSDYTIRAELQHKTLISDRRGAPAGSSSGHRSDKVRDFQLRVPVLGSRRASRG